jgi:hypothetical protein
MCFNRGKCMSRRHREVSSASRVVRAGKQILCHFLQLHLQSDGVPTTAWIEHQEVNNFDRIVLDGKRNRGPRIVRSVP